MKSKRTMRKVRPGHVAASAALLVIPSSAVALAAGQADAQSAMHIDVSTTHLTYGARIRVSGAAPTSDAGHSATLQYAPAGSSSWRPLTSTTIASDGSFQLVAPLHASGQLRVLDTGAVSGSRASAASTGSSPGLTSDARSVAVSPVFRVHKRLIEVLGGQRFAVRGRLLPGVAGRRIRLEGRTRRGWRVLGATRTGNRGHFTIHYRPSAPDGPRGRTLRLVFLGDRFNSARSTRAGRFIVFQQAVASWYEDGGNTACGFHAGYGVANLSLPCGTKVTFRYGGRSVVATVDDRGPYVGGRTWDLNQTTAAALGFAGVATVWSSS